MAAVSASVSPATNRQASTSRVALVEAAEQTEQLVDLSVCDDTFTDRITAGGNQPQLLVAVLSPAPPAAPACCVLRLVGDDAQQPGTHRCVAAVAVERPVALDERVLHDVPRLLRRSAHTGSQAQRSGLVAAHQLAERGPISRPGAPDEVLVVVVGRVGELLVRWHRVVFSLSHH